jgi:succinylglutamate desuccinylase
VRARLRTLLDDHHREFLPLCAGELLETDGGSQSGRAGTDDDDVIFHRVARAVLGEDLLGSHEGCPVLLERREF